MNESETAGRDRLFFLKYRNLTIIGGGRPAVILAVGAPLTIVPAVAMLLNVLNEWFLFAIVIVALVLFSTLAGIWMWIERRSTPSISPDSLSLAEPRTNDICGERRESRMNSNGETSP